MFALSFLLVTPSIVLLRKLAQSTLTLQTWVMQKLKLSRGSTNRKPRFVWGNPIAWREAKTKASAARATLLRYGFMTIGVLGACVLLWYYSSTTTPPRYIDRTSYDGGGTFTVYTPDAAENYEVRDNVPVDVKINGQAAALDELKRKMAVTITTSGGNSRVLQSVDASEMPSIITASQTQQYLLGATIIEFAIILLIVTNAAASTVTREKEDGSLDLLLTTPITSRYYIWGKLRGLVSFVLPLIAVPGVSLLIFVVYDLFRAASGRTGARWIVLPEATLVLPGMFVIVCAFAAILGMQMSLRLRTTVMAVMASVGIVAGVTGTLGWCGYAFLSGPSGSNGPGASVVVGSFSPFTLMGLLVNPQDVSDAFRTTNPTWQNDLNDARVIIFISAWVAIGVYTAIVWAMYTSMVKNFDMTIRRQSR
jgi:ABC-type transport system involved in multi-copper enzyme maturation permease subunit